MTRPMPEGGRVAWLAKSQADVTGTRERLAQALAFREDMVRTARSEGMTIYRIAQVLGVTQGAVRKMLGL